MAERVATYSFTVPLAEEPAPMYDGGFIDVRLDRPAYAPGERIRMIVRVWVWRSARWVDIWWGSFIVAYDARGRELTRVAASHLATPGVADREEYDVDLDLGTQPPEGLSGHLELWCEGSPAVRVATIQFDAPLPEEPPPPARWKPYAIGAGAIAVIAIALAALAKR